MALVDPISNFLTVVRTGFRRRKRPEIPATVFICGRNAAELILKDGSIPSHVKPRMLQEMLP